jgi:hypothetical protein
MIYNSVLAYLKILLVFLNTDIFPVRVDTGYGGRAATRTVV